MIKWRFAFDVFLFCTLAYLLALFSLSVGWERGLDPLEFFRGLQPLPRRTMLAPLVIIYKPVCLVIISVLLEIRRLSIIRCSSAIIAWLGS